MHIIFKIFPAHSHLNATFKFAKLLKDKGYRITYAGIKKYEKEPLSQGFEYFVDDDVFPDVPPSSRIPSFFEKVKSKKHLKKYHNEYLKGTGFDNIISNLNPDLIVVDSPYTRHSIPLFNKGIRFVIFESMVALNKAPLHPPLSSKIVVNDGMLNKFWVYLSWKKFFLKSAIKEMLFGAMLPPNYLVKKLCKITNFPVNQIDFDRYFHVGLNNVPEIIASPMEFDFPYEKRDNQYYIGTSVNTDRKESSYDFKYDEARKNIENILEHNKSCKPEDKITLIYCSFGTMAWRYEGVTNFYKKLIKAFGSDKNIKIFISIGYEFSYHLFKGLPDNINIFRKVPQMDLLKKVDMMITHGGMNTITECILLEVPMLVYPGSNEIDQIGNACRVEFHKIGLMGDLKKDSAKLIKKKVFKILKNEDHKVNVHKMKLQILENKGSDEVLLVIEEMLSKNQRTVVPNQMINKLEAIYT